MADELHLPKELVIRTPENIGDVLEDLVAVEAKVNGNVGAGNLAGASVGPEALAENLAFLVGATHAGARAFSRNAAQQDITSASYTTGAIPDRVTIETGPDEMLMVGYLGHVWNDVLNAGRAALFVDGVQLTMLVALDTQVAQEATLGTASRWHQMTSTGFGLNAGSASVNIPFVGATPMIAKPGGGNSDGFWCPIFVNPGSHTVEVRYRATSGRIATIDRRLWARTMAYAGRPGSLLNYESLEYAEGSVRDPYAGELGVDVSGAEPVIKIALRDQSGADQSLVIPNATALNLRQQENAIAVGYSVDTVSPTAYGWSVLTGSHGGVGEIGEGPTTVEVEYT